MNNIYNYKQQYPYYESSPQYHVASNMHNTETTYQTTEFANAPMYNTDLPSNKQDEAASRFSCELKDYGPMPFVVNIEEVTKQNTNFRTALWTGNHLQLTLMSIPVNGEIGLEIHPDLDQFIRIEDGQGLVKMGDRKDYLIFQEKVYDDYAFIIPAGKWHNLINTGNKPIKLYSIYAPPQHPHGTVHITKDMEAAEEQKYERKITSANNYYGAEAAKTDNDLNFEDMLTYAIQDEFLARAGYLAAIEKFGRQRPFANIIVSEENHINYLKSLFAKYNITVPTDDSKSYIKIPADIKESLEAGVKKEVENIEMYERFLKESIPNDVKTIFTFLRNASQNHLSAFQRALSFY